MKAPAENAHTALNWYLLVFALVLGAILASYGSGQENEATQEHQHETSQGAVRDAA